MGSDKTIDEAQVRAAIADLATLPGALLPMLHRVQERFGCVPPVAVSAIARTLNLSRAEVHGVVTFYHDFRETPAGRHVVKICRAEACQSMGADRLIAHAESRLGVSLGATRTDAEYTLEPIYCLGNCALSPAAVIDGEIHGRVSAERFDALLAAAESTS